MVVLGAVAVPGGDTARQDALHGASVEVCEGLRGQAEFLQPPEVEEALFCAFFTPLRVGGPFQIVSDVYDEELDVFHLLYCGPVDVDRGVLLCCFLKSTISSFILLTLRERLFSWDAQNKAYMCRPTVSLLLWDVFVRKTACVIEWTD